MKFISLIVLLTLMVSLQRMQAQSTPAIQWQRCFGGSLDDTGYGITATADGGFLIAGCAGSSDGDLLKGEEIQHGGTCDFWALKIDAWGNNQFKIHLGGTKSDIARTAALMSNGNYALAGIVESNDVDVTGNHGIFDYWLVTVSPAGDVLTKKCFGGSKYDDFGSMIATADGGLALCGGTQSNDGDVSGNHGDSDYWLVKTDADGNIQWQKCFGGTNYEKAFDLFQSSDGGFLLAGFTESNDGDVSGNHSTDYDGWVIKTDASGNLQWQKCLGGSGQDGLFKIIELDNQKILAAGYAYSSNGDIAGNKGEEDAWLVLLDAAGEVIWSKTVGGDSSDRFNSVQQDPLGNFIAGGFTQSVNEDVSFKYGDKDFWLTRFDTTGQLLWETVYGGTYAEVGYDIALSSEATLGMIGFTSSNDFDVSGNHGAIGNFEVKKDYWVIKLSSVVGINETTQTVLSLQPTLTSGELQIPLDDFKESGCLLRVYDVYGSVKLELEIASPSSTILDVHKLPGGSYFVEVVSAGKKAVGRFVKF